MSTAICQNCLWFFIVWLSIGITSSFTTNKNNNSYKIKMKRTCVYWMSSCSNVSKTHDRTEWSYLYIGAADWPSSHWQNNSNSSSNNQWSVTWRNIMHTQWQHTRIHRKVHTKMMGFFLFLFLFFCSFTYEFIRVRRNTFRHACTHLRILQMIFFFYV